VRAAGERFEVQRFRVFPVDPVAYAAQPRELAQVLGRAGPAGHLRDRAMWHTNRWHPAPRQELGFASAESPEDE
jgi:hypothetical protein